MAGAVLERELTPAGTGRIEFELATQADDPDIRRLLRENPIPSRISLSLERESDYFTESKARKPADAECQTIIAREQGRIICIGNSAIRQRFVNGQPRRIGYLSSLRLDAAFAGRFDILRRGYEFFRELQASAPAEFYFTSIAADNERARKFLERGIRGMPRYEFVGEFVTVLIPTARRMQPRGTLTLERTQLRTEALLEHQQSDSPDRSGLLSFLNEQNSKHQFASCWSEDDLASLQSLDLRESDFCILRDRYTRIAGCAALWDQRNFKQTVIRGYAPWLALVRPMLNAATPVTNQPRLPAIGETLSHGFASPLATRTDDAGALIDLIATLRGMASKRGIEILTLGFAADDPKLATVQSNFRSREYHSRIYTVRWPGIGGAARDLKRGLLAPEVALL